MGKHTRQAAFAETITTTFLGLVAIGILGSIGVLLIVRNHRRDPLDSQHLLRSSIYQLKDLQK